MLTTRRFTSGDLEVRELIMSEVGDTVPAHDHFFDHTSIVFSGSFLVRVSNKGTSRSQIVTTGEHLLIKAEDMHYIECLSPGKIWCTFCARHPETGAMIKEIDGWDVAAIKSEQGV
jgi:hypothetical protein